MTVRRELARSIHRVAGDASRRSRSTYRGEVESVDPMVLSVYGQSDTLDEDEFEFSQLVRSYDQSIGLAVGDTVLMIRDGEDYLVTDVFSDEDVDGFGGNGGGGGAPSGPAGGDLKGNYPDPQIALGVIVDANVATANKDGTAGTPSMRTLGTGAQQAAAGNDPRLSDNRPGPPTGAAGGDLSGTYPNPDIAAGAIVNADINAAAGIAKSKLAALGIVDADVAAGAAIAKTKLAALNIVNADVAAGAAIAYSKLSLIGSVVNADIAAAAAIARSKLDFGVGLVNADIASAAGIVRSKLDFGTGLVNGDIAAAAAISYGKLALTGAILNADLAGGIALSKLATDPLARANHTGTQLAATISDFNTAVRTNRLDQMAAPSAAVSLGSQQITNLADPIAATDGANKQYVDALIQGLDALASVKAASTANLTLSGTQTVDGIALLAGDRVLVKDQTTAAQNGVYLVQSGAWTRSLDADVWNELVSAYTWVEQGTLNGDSGWVCTVDQGGTLGTTAVTWVKFATAGGATGAAGGDLSGTYPNPIVLKSTGDFAVGGMVDVTAGGGTAPVGGTAIGDKISLYGGSGSQYGIGIQSGAMVAYVGSAIATFSVRAVAPSGNKSSGANGISFAPNGTITFATDVNLYRSAVDILKTDDQFQSATLVRVIPAVFGAAYRAGLAADTALRYEVDTNGRITWGDGTAAGDTFLARKAVGLLVLDSGTTLRGEGTAGQNMLQGYVTGEAFVRFNMSNAGGMTWGPGSAGADTNLYRGGTDILKTDDSFHFGAAAGAEAWRIVNSGTQFAMVGVTGAPNAPDFRFGDGTGWMLGFAPLSGAKAGIRFLRIRDTGVLEWADPTTGVGDVNLYRSAADILVSDDRIVSRRALAADTAFNVWLGNFHAWYIMGDGKMWWADGAGTTADTNLYRSGANKLQTDDDFTCNELYMTAASAVIAAATGVNNVIRILTTDAAGAYRERLFIGAGKDGIEFSTSRDVNLYRSAADILKTDDNFQTALAITTLNGQITATRSTTGLGAFAAYITGGAQPKFKITPTTAGADLEWSDGTNAADVKLYRSAADVLKTDDRFEAASLSLPTGGGRDKVLASDAFGLAGWVVPDDNTLLWGSGPPPDTLGSFDDAYFDRTNGTIYGPKAAVAASTPQWTNLVANPSGEGGATIVPSVTASSAITNSCRNPSFELDTAGWSTFITAGQGTTSAVSRVTTDSYRGAACAEATVTGLPDAQSAMIYTPSGTQWQAVTGGTSTVYVHGALKVVSGGPLGASGYLRLAIRWMDAANAYISSSTVQTQLNPTTGQWYDMAGSAVAPANAAWAGIDTWIFNGSGATIPTLVWHADGFYLSTSNPGGTYFDGDTQGCRWTGTAHASTSTTVAVTTLDSAAWARYGTHSSRVTLTRIDSADQTTLVARQAIGTSGIPVTAGRYYAARTSARVVSVSGGGTVHQLITRIYWWKSDGTASTIASNSSGVVFSNPVVGQAYDGYIIAQAPSDAAFGTVTQSFGNKAGFVAQIVLDVDGFALYDMGAAWTGAVGASTREGDVPPYFDGIYDGTPSGAHSAWTGTANNSPSIYSTTDSRWPTSGYGITGEYAWVNPVAGTATSTATPVNTWALLPLPSAAPWFTTPSGAFTRNADGTLTVRDAGYYAIFADVNASTAWATADVRLITGINLDTAGDNVARNDAMSGANDYPATTLSGVTYIAAGQKIVVGYYGVANAGSVQVVSFSISRIGAGPQGPQGPQGAFGSPPYVSVLPASPADGDEVYFYVSGSAGPFAWHLKYNAGWFATDGYGWVFLGGAPLKSEVQASETTASTTYGDLTTVGPGVTIPLAGTYEIEYGARLITAAVLNNSAIASLSVNNGASADADWAILSTPAAGQAGASVYRYMQKLLAKNDSLTVRYRSSVTAPGTITAAQRWMKVRPVRLG